MSSFPIPNGGRPKCSLELAAIEARKRRFCLEKTPQQTIICPSSQAVWRRNRKSFFLPFSWPHTGAVISVIQLPSLSLGRNYCVSAQDMWRHLKTFRLDLDRPPTQLSRGLSERAVSFALVLRLWEGTKQINSCCKEFVCVLWVTWIWAEQEMFSFHSREKMSQTITI